MPNTSRSDARAELFGYMTRGFASYTSPKKPQGSSIARSIVKGPAGTHHGTSRKAENKPVTNKKLYNQRTDPATPQKGAGFRSKTCNPFAHSPGRTIYNAGPYGDLIDMVRSDEAVDPALIAIHKVIEDVRLKQRQWLEFVRGEGPEHWAHPDNIKEYRTPGTPSSTPRTTPRMSPASSASSASEETDADETEMDIVFERYINYN